MFTFVFVCETWYITAISLYIYIYIHTHMYTYCIKGPLTKADDSGAFAAGSRASHNAL